MDQRFQTLITRIRPHRIAVLIDSNDPQWQHTCKRIIEWLSQIWGGAHSIIIPTDGKTIDHQFWTILSSFDPDEIVSYLKTNADVEMYAPAEFASGVTALAESWASRDPDAGDLRGQAEETWRSWPVNDFSLSSELEGELLRRIAPFHLNEAIQIPQIRALDTPPYPYTKVIDIVEYVGAPDYIFEVVNNREPDSQMPPSLWLLSEIGLTTQTYKDALAAKGIQTATKLIRNDSEFDMIKWGITPSTAFETNSPFDFTRLALRQVRANASHQHTIPSVLVVGDTIADYCLYLALSRLHGRAIWLPSWFMPPNEPGYPTRLMSAVNSLEDISRRASSRQYALISTSIENHNLRELGKVISQRMTRNTFVVEDGESPLFIGKLVAHPLKFYVVGNMERITTHLLVDDKLPGHFESPVPSSFLSIDMYKHRWLVEVTFSQNQTPRNAILGNYLASDPNLWAVRAAIDGLTYSCPGGLVQGSESELQMLRPSLTIPNAERIFRIVLSDCGYDCLVSDKGAYEAQTIAKFGGLKQAGDALRRPQTEAFLKKYLDDSPNKGGIHDEGALLRDKRRYLNFACIRKIIGDTELSVATVDDYIAKKILYRGLVLGCSRCADVSWFAIGDVTDCFTCRRCGLNQQYAFANWKHSPEPAWFYKLDEMVYQMLAHDGDVTIRTLDVLRNASKRSFIYAPELALVPAGQSKPEMEIDICCILDGQALIGESKSVNTLKDKGVSPLQAATRYRELASKINASGVVFSTFAESWNDVTSKAIDSTFSDYPHLKVIKLVREQL